MDVARRGTDSQAVLENLGFGYFVVSETIPLGMSPHALTVGDFDGDGVNEWLDDAEPMNGDGLPAIPLNPALFRLDSSRRCMACHVTGVLSGRPISELSEADRYAIARWLAPTPEKQRLNSVAEHVVTGVGSGLRTAGDGEVQGAGGDGRVAAAPVGISTIGTRCRNLASGVVRRISSSRDTLASGKVTRIKSQSSAVSPVC